MSIPWWQGPPRRLIQTNLNERDIRSFDQEAYVRTLEEFSADTVIFNTGGIVANYPTALPWHFPNPYLEKDLFPGLIEALHCRDIRIVARFDMSKINASLKDRYKDSLCVNREGGILDYNGQVQVCVNSPYQQELALEILKEALGTYDFDGVFFNMPGYLTSDYSGNYFGLCQCGSCRKRFREFTGRELPHREAPEDPAFAAYEGFRQWTTDELFDKIRRTVKGIREDIAIFNYAETGVDVYRLESNSSLSRPLPEWEYSPREHVSKIETTWSEVRACNSSVHFVDYPFRFSGVSPFLAANRTIQTLVQGAWLDFYAMGYLDRLPDRSCLPLIRELYRFQKEHISHYTGTRSEARCCVLCPDYRRADGKDAEFRGIARMLITGHIPFDVLDQRGLDIPGIRGKLGTYSHLILAGPVLSDPAQGQLLEEYVRQGGTLIVTGTDISPELWGCLGLRAAETVPGERASYWRISGEDRQACPGLEAWDLLYLDGPLLTCSLREEARGLLEKLSPAPYGPPEKCFRGEPTGVPGTVLHRLGSGQTALIPWQIGTLYERRSFHGHRQYFLGLLAGTLAYEKPIEGLPPLVQAFLRRRPEGEELQLSLVNQTGQSGTEFFAPAERTGLRFLLRGYDDYTRCTPLRGGRAEIRHTGVGMEIRLDRLKDFDTLIFTKEPKEKP